MALCAAALCLQTSLFYETVTVEYNLIAFVFFSTLLSYNVHFYLASLSNPSSEQTTWFYHRKTTTTFVNILSLLATGYFLMQLQDLWLYIGIAALLNVGYTAPLLLKKPLQLPVIFTIVKSYFIGFTWAAATVVFPLALLQTEHGLNELIVFIHRLLLVSTATLLFDYRDRQRDLKQGVLTPANMMDEKQFQLFFYVNVFLFLITTTGLILLFPSLWHWMQLLVAFYFLWLHAMSKKRGDDLFYLTWVDGSLFLSALLSLFLLI